MTQVVSPSLVGALHPIDWRGADLCFARIGWHTYTRNAVVSASTSAEGWPAAALNSPMTYERWKPSAAPAWVRFDMGKNVEVDYIGIAAHDLYIQGATVTLQYSLNGSDWTTIDTFQPSRDDAFLFWFDPVVARYFRIQIDKVAYIGVVYLGKILVMQRGCYGGHTPGTLARQTAIMPNKSEGGQFLGRSIIRQGYATSYEWKHLEADWYRQYFDPFVESARKYPFFVSWFPKKYPDEVLYAWTNEDIAPSNMGKRDYMQVSLSVEALA